MQESMARSRSTEATWTSFAGVAIARPFDGVTPAAPKAANTIVGGLLDQNVFT
jgi:hypothetical protein